MPSEVRIIVFTSQDVLQAITEFSKTLEPPLLRGNPTDIFVRKKREAVFAVVEIDRDGSGTVETVDLDASHLAAALIIYCRTAHIPLPRNAKKELDVLGDQIVLRLEVGTPNQAVVEALKLAS